MLQSVLAVCVCVWGECVHVCSGKCVCVYVCLPLKVKTLTAACLPNYLALLHSLPAVLLCHALSLSLSQLLRHDSRSYTHLRSSLFYATWRIRSVCCVFLCVDFASLSYLASLSLAFVGTHTEKIRQPHIHTHTRTLTRSTCSFLPPLFAFASLTSFLYYGTPFPLATTSAFIFFAIAAAVATARRLWLWQQQQQQQQSQQQWQH